MVAGTFALAQAPHLTVPVQGGMPGLPLITEIHTTGTNEVEVRWDGPAGLYRLMRKLDLTDAEWLEAVGWNAERAATVTAVNEKEFFSVIGPSPNYAGSISCAACHAGIHNSEMDTRHADALETLKGIGQDNNPGCLPCHTVGFQLPTGFITESLTPHLAGVQCENCHGPSGLHVADPFDLTVRPRVEIASEMCGGCHTGSQHPTFEEWVGTGHKGVSLEMNGGRIDRCGRCHSGSSRLAQLAGEDPAVTVEGDANVGITCVVCHDPHQNTPHGHQLRNPTASTNDYFLTTSGSAAGGGGLLDQYDPNVNLCAQCHNHRGAVWTSTGSAPHRSPQYNILLGTVGELPEGTVPRGGGHARRIGGQCASCHMQTLDYESEEQPAVTGHKFQVESFDVCMGCHSDPEGLADLAMIAVGSRILDVKALLDEWGENHSPETLRTNYGALAWEYTSPGDLSEGDGPDADEQALIPDTIKKARFNLYVSLYDGSLGIHNGKYAVDLLDAAYDWVLAEFEDEESAPDETGLLQ